MVNRRSIIGLLLVAFSASLAFAAEDSGPYIDTRKVRAYSVEEGQKDLNPFQRDCQAVLKPVESYLHTVQSKRGSKNIYQLRVSGQLSGSVKVGFSSDKITYVDQRGDSKDYNFHLKQIPIAQAKGGDFSFSLMLKPGQAVIPLTFSEMFDQNYLFVLQIAKDGKILDAALKPAWDPETRKKLCQRDHLRLSTGMSLYSFDQSFQTIEGKISSVSTLSPSLGVNYVHTQSPLYEHVYDLSYIPGKVSAANQFQKDFQFNWLTAKYHYQTRKINWSSSWRNLLVQPFVRYGGQLHMIPYISIEKADEADLKTMNMLNASVGGGVNITNEKDWLIEMGLNLQYPLYASIGTQYQMMFDGSVAMSKAINNKYYYGMTWHGQYNQMNYTAESALNKSGSTQFVTSNIELIFGYLF